MMKFPRLLPIKLFRTGIAIFIVGTVSCKKRVFNADLRSMTERGGAIPVLRSSDDIDAFIKSWAEADGGRKLVGLEFEAAQRKFLDPQNPNDWKKGESYDFRKALLGTLPDSVIADASQKVRGLSVFDLRDRGDVLCPGEILVAPFRAECKRFLKENGMFSSFHLSDVLLDMGEGRIETKKTRNTSAINKDDPDSPWRNGIPKTEKGFGRLFGDVKNGTLFLVVASTDSAGKETLTLKIEGFAPEQVPAGEDALEFYIKKTKSQGRLVKALNHPALGFIDVTLDGTAGIEVITSPLSASSRPALCKLVTAMENAGAVGAQDLPGFELTVGLHVNVSGEPEKLSHSLRRLVSFWNENGSVVLAAFGTLPKRASEYSGKYPERLANLLQEAEIKNSNTPEKFREELVIQEGEFKGELKEGPLKDSLSKYQAINLVHMIRGAKVGDRDAFEVRIFDAAYVPSTKRPNPCAYVSRTVDFSRALVNWAEAIEEK